MPDTASAVLEPAIDKSDHITEALHDALLPRGPQTMVVMLQRYDRYMRGEVVQFPTDLARRLIARGVAEPSTATNTPAVLPPTPAEPLVGIQFRERWGVYMVGDIAGLPPALALSLVEDRGDGKGSIGIRVALPGDATPGPLGKTR